MDTSPPVKLSPKSGTSSTDGTNRRKKSYSDKSLAQALHDITRGKLSVQKASVKHNIPRTTLHFRLRNLESSSSSVGGTAPALPASLEDKLVQWLQYRDAMGARVSNSEVLSAVRSLNMSPKSDDQDSLPRRAFQRDIPTTGWLMRFKKRHPSIPIMKTKLENWYSPTDFKPSIMHQWILSLYEKFFENKICPLDYFLLENRSQIFCMSVLNLTYDAAGNVSASEDIVSDYFTQVVCCYNASGFVCKPIFVCKSNIAIHFQNFSYPSNFDVKIFVNDDGFDESCMNFILQELFSEEITAQPILLLIKRSLAYVGLDVYRLSIEKKIILKCFPLHSDKVQPMTYGPTNSIIQSLLNLGTTVIDSPADVIKIIVELWQNCCTKAVASESFSQCGLVPLSQSYLDILPQRTENVSPGQLNDGIIKGMELALNTVETKCIDPHYLPLYEQFLTEHKVPKSDSVFTVWKELKLALGKLKETNSDSNGTAQSIVEPSLHFDDSAGGSDQSPKTAQNLALVADNYASSAPTDSQSFNNSQGCDILGETNGSGPLRDSVPISDRYRREFNFDAMPALNLEQHANEIMEKYHALSGNGQLQELHIDAETDFDPDVLDGIV